VAVLEFWVFLTLEGALGPLLKYKDIKVIYKSNGSAIEIFRAFLKMEKVKRGFRPWIYNNINQVVFSVHRQKRQERSKQSYGLVSKQTCCQDYRTKWGCISLLISSCSSIETLYLIGLHRTLCRTLETLLQQYPWWKRWLKKKSTNRTNFMSSFRSNFLSYNR
jgi:hypothetical protein